MDLEAIEQLILEQGTEIHGRDGAWEFEVEDVRVAVLTDEHFDRMRIIAPIVETDGLTEEHVVAMLEANFHTALDARYATSDGVLYAAFIHPLSPLTPSEFSSALVQVTNLVRTFGTTYSGGTVVFGTAGSDDPPN